MKNKIKVKALFLCMILLGGVWHSFTMTVNAEEIEVPGYHEYIDTEEESIDHWYGIARGTITCK